MAVSKPGAAIPRRRASGLVGAVRPYLRPQDPLRLARSSAGPPARQQERIADGARKARDPAEHQRLRERRSLPGHQAQDQRRNPQRRRPRLPRRLSRPPEDLRQERHRILGLPRRTPQSPRLPTYPSPRRNRQRARPPAAMIASAFAPVTKKAPNALNSLDAELKSSLAFRRLEGTANPAGARASRSKR